MFRNFYLLAAAILLILTSSVLAQGNEKPQWEDGVPDECTTITVGKLASYDGSVMTSHTDDSHRTRSWMDIVPSMYHQDNEFVIMYERKKDDSHKMPTYKHIPVGQIPQVEETYGFINTAYPCINEKQVAIGETTLADAMS